MGADCGVAADGGGDAATGLRAVGGALRMLASSWARIGSTLGSAAAAGASGDAFAGEGGGCAATLARRLRGGGRGGGPLNVFGGGGGGTRPVPPWGGGGVAASFVAGSRGWPPASEVPLTKSAIKPAVASLSSWSVVTPAFAKMSRHSAGMFFTSKVPFAASKPMCERC